LLTEEEKKKKKKKKKEQMPSIRPVAVTRNQKFLVEAEKRKKKKGLTSCRVSLSMVSSAKKMKKGEKKLGIHHWPQESQGKKTLIISEIR